MSLSKRSKLLFIVLILLIIGGYASYSYIYKSHPTIEELEVKFSGTSKEFLEKVKTDTTVWQDVIVELSGVVTAKDEQGIMIDNSTYCQLKDKTALGTIKEGESIAIKGRMIGYDDLLEEVKLDQTIIK